jgi:hypothetical protein
MNANPLTPDVGWHDPIVEELHELRAQLLEKYQGDLHAYSEVARARALALGFQFTTIKALESRDVATLHKNTSTLT